MVSLSALWISFHRWWNSWWKCRQSCLPRASLFRSRSSSSTLQFLVVVANGVFKVFSQDRVQQRRLLRRNAFLSGLWSSPFSLLLRNALLSGLASSAGPADEDFAGFFRTFPRGKKSARAAASPSAELAREVSSWTPAAYVAPSGSDECVELYDDVKSKTFS